ncbi:cation diffusion facilitator family transporter [Desertifilum sp. FACHB-1129]|uniref:Cation transporter n=1 Tax=Desertifilum tharense IPPAS B-1220 TaxID=1781255 RepID=A0A1E5QL73_9CYAN|nr:MULTISPECIES: cation diffusion facilitator family transporter [Desertifilum]MCD8488089.1 cation diffusion facilitator family transporter [Desertifilum sp.]MDA0212836.1 cation diffusion facilitator family transporter [Cyanobacteria bacterium FC1]MDI9640095.1 cation diffusion facilitator family transporter [Geitlerinema splendidum]MBD2314458.1 cation diffusion facilitator family transporter [Desertifilum sp. FACHB-1129]MBD2321707.1 cation diffusion facilitator family transporter [Desertifilum
MAEAQGHASVVRRLLFTTFWLTLLVLAVKVWAGWSTRSLSLLAAALYTLIDTFSLILSLIAVASPYSQAKLPIYGHSKLETTGLLLLVAFLGFTGMNLLSLSLQQLAAFPPSAPALISWPSIQLLGVVAACLCCLGIFIRYEAIALSSLALVHNARNTLLDAGMTLSLLFGLAGVAQGWAWLDPLLAIILLGLVVASVIRLLNYQLPLLVGHIAIAPEVLAKMACAVEGVTYCDSIQSWGVVGRGVFVRLRLVLQPEFLAVSNVIAERLEKTIRDRYGPVWMLIYIDTTH